ncbi:hypothetical protein PTNB73_01903 [Pyrenophora teres f. teres]|nr:hypothetical protein HRS9139_00490 [Pyrenophora teres f. teres]KAE8848061.1 hypothetical protein PTNB85_01904 [Pyrenophora teres f. teres]KAE8867986.1 hypothetical protein PTNB29_01897 [Pyrenophora teres f. teres]KAE8872752.1 hypothetical protein PTNB73_01903 [Pyrenophora teres f. teres]
MSQPTSTDTRAVIHKPPHRTDVEIVSVILYGGMSTDTKKNWRADLSASLSDLPIAILDPTCDAWDSTWIEDISFQPFKDQAKWEMDHAGVADVIVFHFGGKSDQPITLLELGLYAHTGKAVWVSDYKVTLWAPAAEAWMFHHRCGIEMQDAFKPLIAAEYCKSEQAATYPDAPTDYQVLPSTCHSLVLPFAQLSTFTSILKMPTQGGYRLLSLDGGGVRGLASLYMLRKILSFVGSPKPCDYFDMICGTSTGGLIAIMLGRLEMSIDQCIEAYIEMMDVIFDPKDRRKLPFKIRNGKVQPKYKTKHIEQAIKQVISKAGRTSDDPFRGTKDSYCKTVVLALTEESRAPTLFTDYPKDGEHSNFYNEVKIWEVARATSAATSFFPPMEITRAGEPRRFLDAGLGFNNPIQELYVEAMAQFDKSEGDFDSQVRVLVSIGTGKPALRGFGEKVVEVAKSIASIATETQHTANNFHLTHMKLADRGGYFRFNPPDLSEVAIDEASMKGTIAARTETYGNDPETVAMVQRWKNTAGTEQIPSKSSIKSRPLAKSVPTKLFYSLHNGPLYIRKDTSAYWQHLTLDSYYKYEEIYDRCAPRDRKVTFDSFFAQFGPSRTPSPSQVTEVWMRMLRDTNNVRRSIHRKPFIMAVLYMLHLETSLPDISKMTIIEPNRREMLKRFVKWVPCQCEKKCGRQWNFVNEIGLSRGQTDDECDLVDLYNHGDSWKLVFKGAKVKRLEATRRLWEATTA